MRRLHFSLMRAEEELAGARQCIVCLCGAVLTASGALVLLALGLLPPWALAGAALLTGFFLAAGVRFLCPLER